MPLSNIKFILTVAFLLLVFSCIYVAVFSFQVGASVKAEWWLKNVYDYKDFTVSKVNSPKIIIIGGSNALFGIDSSIIENETSYPVINLAGHGGLDLSFFYLKLEEHIGEGDIVVMPLEFGYFQLPRLSDWFVNNMIAWGKEDYIGRLEFYEFLSFIVSVPKTRVYEGILKKNRKSLYLSQEKAIAQTEKIINENREAWRGYSHLSLNQYGDFISGDSVAPEVLARSRKGYHYYWGWDLSDYFIKNYNKIESLISKHNGQMIFTWSVTMNNPKFDLSDSNINKRLVKLMGNLEASSISLSCNLEDFHYNTELFFDTEFHLNKKGTTIRSYDLANCINKTLQSNLNL